MTLLALFVVLLVLYLALSYLRWSGGSQQDVSQEDKYRILSSLHSSTTPSVDVRSQILQALSPESSATPSKEDKLKVLESLKARP